MSTVQPIYMIYSDRAQKAFWQATTEKACDILCDNTDFYDCEGPVPVLPVIRLCYVTLDGAALDPDKYYDVYADCVAFRPKNINNIENNVNKNYESDPTVLLGMIRVYTDKKTHSEVYVRFPMYIDGKFPDHLYFCNKCKHPTAVKCHETECENMLL